jgi:8-oxo-dGTP pyrophosphatase MutT (NUDIX family)
MAHIHEKYDFTASAFIMHPTEPKLLLLHHKKIGKWLQPGGHVELDENPLQALHHELQEETGLLPKDYDILEPAEQPATKGTNITLPLPFYFNEHPFNETHRHIDLCYLVKAKVPILTDNPDGALAISWLSLADIRKKHSNGDMFDDTLQICEWIFAHKIQQ